ncbi:MAG: DUF4864 domain-containing protein [Rhizobiales bacterium]|nr:DUF4864 domain-containing protein [Rhizobacter sp.]
MFKSLVCALLLCCVSLPSMAQAAVRPGEVSDTDSRAVRAVVESQLKALAAGDAAQAFSHASPAIQQQFQDAAAFDQMVRRSYPMLIRPASVSFYRPLANDEVVIQSVLFRDRDGRAWRADYQLERQPDRRWRINGCQVAPGDDASTT